MGLVVFSVFWDRTMQMVRQPSRTFTSLLAPQNTKEQHSGEKQKARRNHHSLQHECHDDGDDDDDDEGDDDEVDDDESVDIFKRACLIDDRPALWSPFHPDCCYCCCY